MYISHKIRGFPLPTGRPQGSSPQAGSAARGPPVRGGRAPPRAPPPRAGGPPGPRRPAGRRGRGGGGPGGGRGGGGARTARRAPLPLPASPPCRSFIFRAKDLPGTHGTGRREFSFAGSPQPTLGVAAGSVPLGGVIRRPPRRSDSPGPAFWGRRQRYGPSAYRHFPSPWRRSPRQARGSAAGIPWRYHGPAPSGHRRN